MKINWKEVWKKNGKWFDNQSWPTQRKNIQKLVEEQLKKSNPKESRR